MATFCDSTFVGTLVVDVGAVTTRVGYAGDDSPRAIYPSAVCAWVDDAGGPQHGVLEHEPKLSPETFARLEARAMTTRSGAVDEWVLRGLLDHGLQQLGCISWAAHPVLLTEPTCADSSMRRHTAEFMFEEMGVPALCVSRSAELVAVGVGAATAVVLELGGEAATAAVVADGMVMTRSVQRSPFGGVNIARTLMKLASKHPSLGSTGIQPACTLRAPCHVSYRVMRDNELARDLLETVGRCAEFTVRPTKGKHKGAAVAPAPAPTAEYTLPDGRTLELGEQSTSVSEHLFNEHPVEAGGLPPLQALVLNSIATTDGDLHKELMRHVVLTGGMTSMPGLPERFEAELRAAANASTVQSILNVAHRTTLINAHPHDRRHGAWLGGSILGSLGSHHELWMSRAEYEEYGASLITRKGMQYTW